VEWQTAQKQIVDQAEDRGIQPDPQRQCDQREQSEPGRLAQLPESKTKISHHKKNRIYGFKKILGSPTQHLNDSTSQHHSDAPTGAIGFN
jgi:hypothetical protein